jgi:hypothetical protein
LRSYPRPLVELNLVFILLRLLRVVTDALEIRLLSVADDVDDLVEVKRRRRDANNVGAGSMTC